MQFRTVLPSATSVNLALNLALNIGGRARPAAAFLALATLLGATGCDDLGKCDETQARKLVINGGGQAIYAGQSVINLSCAAGQCHAAGASGSARQGVPEGLDFDLQPATLVPGGQEGGVASGKLQVDAKALSRLRSNQRLVFDRRAEIWDQIKDGLMPPDGVGAAYRKAEPGADVTVQGTTCKRGTEEVAPISAQATKTIVRNWLACGAPVVEVSDVAVDVSVLMQEPAGEPGTVGQQMPLCVDCDAPISFDDLYANVLKQSCVAGCHTAGGLASPENYDGFDLTDLDTAYASLTKAGATGGSEDCNMPGAPLVVPGDPAASYLVAKMGGGAASPLAVCGATMPLAQPVLECGVRQLIKWISDGASKPGEPAGAGGGGGDASDGGMSASDAGM